MTDTRNQLLLAALQRASQPMTSGDVLDAAVGLALANGWTPEQTATLNRKSVSKRLQNLAAECLVAVTGEALDEASRRQTPLYALAQPTIGVEPMGALAVPEAPELRAKESDYADLNRAQLIALLEVHDSQSQCIARFLADLDRWRETSRQRLLAVDLGGRA